MTKLRTLILWFLLLALVPMSLVALISEVDRYSALAEVAWPGQLTLVLTALIGLLAAALAWHQASRISRPIIQLANASRAVAAGDIDQRVAVTANNEIGTLAEAFNRMLEVHQTYKQTLARSYVTAL